MSNSWNPDEMSPDAFCDMIIAEKVGGHGKDIFVSGYYELLQQAFPAQH